MIAFLVLVGMPNMNFNSMLRFSVGLEKSFPDQTLISQEISLNGRSFVRALLQCDAKDRPSATKSLQNNWFRGMNDFVQNLRTMVIQDNRSSDIGANVTISQSHPPIADRPAVLTTQSTSSLVPTAQWSTNQSRQGEGFGFSPEHTAVPLLAQTLTTSKSDSALSESDLLQHRGDIDNTAHVSGMFQNVVDAETQIRSNHEGTRDVLPDTPVTVKAYTDKKFIKLELLLKDLDAAVLPLKVRERRA